MLDKGSVLFIVVTVSLLVCINFSEFLAVTVHFKATAHSFIESKKEKLLHISSIFTAYTSSP